LIQCPLLVVGVAVRDRQVARIRSAVRVAAAVVVPKGVVRPVLEAQRHQVRDLMAAADHLQVTPVLAVVEVARRQRAPLARRASAVTVGPVRSGRHHPACITQAAAAVVFATMDRLAVVAARAAVATRVAPVVQTPVAVVVVAWGQPPTATTAARVS
jgi:hypothetical protein